MKFCHCVAEYIPVEVLKFYSLREINAIFDVRPSGIDCCAYEAPKEGHKPTIFPADP